MSVSDICVLRKHSWFEQRNCLCACRSFLRVKKEMQKFSPAVIASRMWINASCVPSLSCVCVCVRVCVCVCVSSRILKENASCVPSRSCVCVCVCHHEYLKNSGFWSHHKCLLWKRAMRCRDMQGSFAERAI